MKVSEISYPQGLVLTITTCEQPHRSSCHLTGVVNKKEFIVLDSNGVRGEVMPFDCITIKTSTVLNVWSNLRNYYKN